MLAKQPERREHRIPLAYLIGSLRNPQVPLIARTLRSTGIETFDDWYSAGPEADDHWKAYEAQKGLGYIEALSSWAARHVYEFDRFHLQRADLGVLLLPAGRSGHLELGYILGQGKPGYILLDSTTLTEGRWDVMYGLATKVCRTEEELVEEVGKLVFPS